MKTHMTLFGVMALYSSSLFAQGLNNHFEPQVVSSFINISGTRIYLCATLPPGFQKTGGAQLKGASTALANQGDEGFDVARQRFFSLDADCETNLGYVPDNDPLPKDMN